MCDSRKYWWRYFSSKIYQQLIGMKLQTRACAFLLESPEAEGLGFIGSLKTPRKGTFINNAGCITCKTHSIFSILEISARLQLKRL